MDSRMNELDEILQDGFATLSMMNEQVESVLSTVRLMPDGEHKSEVENKLLDLRKTIQAYRERVLEPVKRKSDAISLAKAIIATPNRAVDG